MLSHTEQLVLKHLSQFVSEHKKAGVERVLSKRTKYITIILEDIFQSQNASAVIRTCECMGLQEVHIVENLTKYNINRRVLKGADRWMNLKRHNSRRGNNTESCIKALKSEGYQILVADPDQDAISIFDVDIQHAPIALLFGNELRGVSKEALAHCDQKVTIPMSGFTESLNISVSVAICLSTLVSWLNNSEIQFGLPSAEKEAIRLDWYRKIVRRSALIEREFVRTIE